MKRLFLSLFLLLALGSLCLAQRTNAGGRDEKPPAELPDAAVIEAQLQQDVDFKTAKFGDELAFLTAKDIRLGTVVLAPKGTKVIGRVLNVKPAAKDSGAMLEVIFERIRGAAINTALNASITSVTRATAAKPSVRAAVKGLSVKAATDPANKGTNTLTAATPATKLLKGDHFLLKVNGAPAANQ